MTYVPRLLKEAKIAYQRGEKLIFIVKKREGERIWDIYRTPRVAHGREEYFEGD